MKMQYYGNCTQINGDDIIAMMDEACEVSYRTFIKHVDYKDLNNMFGTKPSLKNEPNVSFYVSYIHGKKCAIVRHSAIEYVFC
jgi:hypothetical protein